MNKYTIKKWYSKFLGGYISIFGITIFGANAMNWTVNISTKRWGYICFTLPVLARIRKNREGKRYLHWYFYLSPNCTPWASTFYIGYDKNENIRAQIRKLNFGHGFDSHKLFNELYTLNHKFEWFQITEYDIHKFGDKTDNLERIKSFQDKTV
jgi:hypothetical protein